ncbi:Hypothetical protein, putative [Bodo saltans]|uniref:Uncharacterized protein n=1 Tax=Bodo saltans TaxID=75058 RepID=A0A0S4JMU8_BODSA|nr:Hypothetical protein, putative [Bodo saltans]|eukprot:CUG91569.1 Hypothetical protein, putative [Bodo saltans]
MRGQFRKKEELADKPNQNHRVPGADEALQAAPNPLLRKRQEVCDKPNSNFLVNGAQEAPLSARVKPTQEVTAKPNMYDAHTGDFHWKHLAGDPASLPQDPYRVRSNSRVAAGGGLVDPPPTNSPRGHVPEPLPTSYRPRPTIQEEQQPSHDLEPKRLPPIASSSPPTIQSNHVSAPTQQSYESYPQQQYPTTTSQLLMNPSINMNDMGNYAQLPPPSAVYFVPQQNMMVPQLQQQLPPNSWTASSDLERLIRRNQEDAQRSFLRI